MIRPLTIDELPLCVPHGAAFHREMGLPGTFIPDIWLENWRAFLERYRAVVLGLWDGEMLVGGLGALITPDLSDGRMSATEMFWFVDSAHRKGRGAIKLVKTFEAWAAAEGAVETRMCHMSGTRDESFDHVYRALGYELLEVSYFKPVKEASHAGD